MASESDETTMTVEIDNGPSREDMIFRGLIDGQYKHFKLALNGNICFVEIDIIGVEYEPKHQSFRITPDRHSWRVRGLMRYTDPHRPGLREWTPFEATYISNHRTGTLTAARAWLTELFGI
ncbi:MAG: hypothetical protein Q8P82_03085 [bacterium]|nr:hypothetical protein [bacterium]